MHREWAIQASSVCVGGQSAIYSLFHMPWGMQLSTTMGAGGERHPLCCCVAAVAPPAAASCWDRAQATGQALDGSYEGMLDGVLVQSSPHLSGLASGVDREW